MRSAASATPHGIREQRAPAARRERVWRLSSPQLHSKRRREVADWITRGIVSASTLLLLETRAGRDRPAVDPGEPPCLWITERAERRASELQDQLRAAQQHLGVPPLDYLIAAVAEDHGASILHYDADFERLVRSTDLAVAVEALARVSSLNARARAGVPSGVGHPAAEGERGVEQAHVAEAGLAHEGFVVLGAQHGEPVADPGGCLRHPLGR